jgi:hypothetical protein
MKVKVLRYCQEKIDGRLTVLDANKIVDVPEVDACRLIKEGFAQSIDCAITGENKMVNILYKKRGRPHKVKNDNI